jgi:mannosylglucosylglycerate synthase
MLPVKPNTTHIVINSLAAKELFERRGVVAHCIPDGFNFNRQPYPLNQKQFRQELGLGDNDLLIGMMARIRINKGVEGAIQFTKELLKQRSRLQNIQGGVGQSGRPFDHKSRIVLMLTQSKDLDQDYFAQLKKLAKRLEVELLYIGDRVVPDISYHGQAGQWPFYSLYQAMEVIVYPSTHEGFGNQAVEAAWAKKILVMREYPVASADIWPRVPELISLGDESHLLPAPESDWPQIQPMVVATAVDKTIKALLDHNLEKRITEANFAAFEKLCGIGR